MTFGEKLKDARKSKKMTQRQLADIIGAKHNSVSDWENNKNKPDPDTIELICGVLEITPNYLLARTNEEFSPTEKILIKQYRELDTHGKEMVDFTLEKEWERSIRDRSNVQTITAIPKSNEPHLMAAHHDNPTDEQIELIKEDIKSLKKPEN